MLRGGSPTSPVKTVNYAAEDLPKVIPSPGRVHPVKSAPRSTYPIISWSRAIRLPQGSAACGSLSLTYPSDPDLVLTLKHYDMNGDLLASGHPGQQRRRHPPGGQFHQHDLRRQRGDPNPERRRAVLRHVQPPDPALRFRGLERPGNLDARRQNSSTTGSDRHDRTLVAQLPEAGSDLRPGRARQPMTSTRVSGSSLWRQNARFGRGLDAGRPGVDRRRRRSRHRQHRGPSGRRHGLAVDPSDPSGNTVYAAGASGGVWKTTDFLTTDPGGPTWIPLTDFGPTSAVNIGSITLFPRNNNPNQSIIIAATGEGDTGSTRRRLPDLEDGGATWTLDDSTDQRRFQRQPAADRIARLATAPSSATRRTRSSSIPSSRPTARSSFTPR